MQLLSAVNFLHSRRVLHRDLKARNVFLKNETVKLGDFGISKILNSTVDLAQTFTGKINKNQKKKKTNYQINFLDF